MKMHQGIWLPDHEDHMIGWMNKSGEIVNGRGTYQIKKLRAALGYVKNWRTAVDVGAHVGFWSMHLVERFDVVQAFEPVLDHRECWRANLAPRESGGSASLYPYALGAGHGMVSLSVPDGSSGGAHIAGAGDIEMRALDSFEFQDVDFLKIDVEGAELAVLEGARETLLRCRPCVIAEQKKHIMSANFGTAGTPAVDYLVGLGAVMRREMGGDYILTWD